MSSTAIERKPLTHAERGAMSSGNKTRPGLERSYTTAEIEAGLQAAATLGNLTLAAKQVEMPTTTLSYWCRDTHRDRYLAIRAEIAPKILERVAADTEDLLREMTEAEAESLAKYRQEIPNLAGKDAAAAVKNLAIAKANSIDKVLLIRGKPTSITIKADATELLRSLSAKGVAQYTDVDSTATEQEDEAAST